MAVGSPPGRSQPRGAAGCAYVASPVALCGDCPGAEHGNEAMGKWLQQMNVARLYEVLKG